MCVCVCTCARFAVPKLFFSSFQASGKTKKSKKKKEKNKQIINLEVNFTDRKKEMLSYENSVYSDEEQDKGR